MNQHDALITLNKNSNIGGYKLQMKSVIQF